MKKLKPFVFILFALALVSCGTSSNYTQNTLNKEFYNGKTIYFMYGYESKNFVSYKGMHASVLGPDLPPDVKQVFKQSIDELAVETKLNLKVVDNLDNINDPSGVLVYAKINEIIWSFGLSVATMKTDVAYTVKPNDKVYSTTGIRKSGGGDPSNNVRKSLKDANYKFLKELEK
ncbi:hypothetical protein PQ459_12660 [Chryseobacterium sp. KACC 21268]|nr:hypothetical protein PQ459_12660 [Chryseobacterium sp. KACC 21268]